MKSKFFVSYGGKNLLEEVAEFLTRNGIKKEEILTINFGVSQKGMVRTHTCYLIYYPR